MKKEIVVFIVLIIFGFCFFKICEYENEINIGKKEVLKNIEVNPLVLSAKKQIGVVVKYDTSYYSGGYPPEDRGACTDVIERALRDQGYDLKKKIDVDMQKFPERYPTKFDPNINYRRVQNIKVFLDYYFEKIDLKGDFKAGDIVTYDQIPGSLWHIAIVSDKKNKQGTPLLIHNYGRGTVEDDHLLTWPTPITGHYRMKK